MPDFLRSIHVVAGVIADTRGRILLARRTATRDMPGLWEFPGGKRESGESSEQALARELNEELGIEAEVGEWLIEVPQLYRDKRLRLEVRRITAWKGSPRGREGQALTWVAPEKLGRYSMPPADLPVVGMLRQPEHYLIAPEPGTDTNQWLACIEQAIQAGIERILLCPGQTSSALWRELLAQLIRGCGKKSVQLLLDRDVELAAELGIGVQLDSRQLAFTAQRPLAADAVVAGSCHDLHDLQHAQRLGCDFALLGPVHCGANHAQSQVLGWQEFERLRERVALPIYAVGGMLPQQLPEARQHGAQGIAAMRSLWPQLMDFA